LGGRTKRRGRHIALLAEGLWVAAFARGGFVRAVRRALSGALLVGAGALAIAAAPAGAGDWPRFGGDAQLTNDVPAAQAAGYVPSAAASLQVRWGTHLDGAVIASPLYADDVIVGGRTENVVYAATQTGSVYAVGAADGTVIWQRQLGTAASTCDETQAGVTAVYGIASTGVIDRSRNVLYVIGATGLLYALDLGTGQTAAGWPLQIVADTSGEYVWGGLTLAGNLLYVPVASYCDVPGLDGQFASGRLVAVDVGSVSIAATFDVVSGVGDLGSIWGWGGASVDPLTGDLWTATGNSWVIDASGDLVQDADYAESVVELDPLLNVLASDRPSDLPGEVDDADFGSTPLLFQPPGCPALAAAYAKNGQLYVWQRDSLSGGPVWSFHAGPSDVTNAFVGEPSYSPELNMLIVSDGRTYDDEGGITHFDAVSGFAIGPGCSLPDAPTWSAPDVGRGPKAPALIIGELAFVVGGYAPGVFALDAATGTVLWSASLAAPALAPPAFGNGQVYVGDVSGVLYAIGIGPTAPPPPPPPPPPPAVKLTVGKVRLTAARAGRPFSVSMAVRNGGEPVRGSVRCTGKLAGRALRAARHASDASGKASCTWNIPAGARGKHFSGSITETYKGSKVSRVFSANVN
jgi:outer membrane protein assembly factor BamB